LDCGSFNSRAWTLVYNRQVAEGEELGAILISERMGKKIDKKKEKELSLRG